MRLLRWLYRAAPGCVFYTAFVGVFTTACVQLPGLPPTVSEAALRIGWDPVGAPAISTAFTDTKNDTPLPDDFAPKRFKSLLELQRSASGGFRLEPGAYALKVRSFCLHAGTRGPSTGEGYLYAPLKGSRADPIRAILTNSVRYAQLKQSDVQSLIWAIEVYAPIRELSSELQSVAGQLLSEKQIFELNGGVIGLIPPDVLNQAVARAPAELREMYSAQADLRRRFTQGGVTFSELESIAVRANAGAAPNSAPLVPRGRWSRHPGGFFVRYLPESYSTTTIQVYVAPGVTPAQLPSRAASLKSEFIPVVAHNEPAGPPAEYDPSEDVATPANTQDQRLGLSGVPAGVQNCDEAACRAMADEALKTCLHEKCSRAVGSQDQIDCELTCIKNSSDMRESCAATGGCSACTRGGCPPVPEGTKSCGCWCSWPNPKKTGERCVSGPNKVKDLSACESYCEAREPPYPCTKPVNAWCPR